MNGATTKTCGHCKGTGQIPLSRIESATLEWCRKLSSRGEPITSATLRPYVPHDGNPTAINNALTLLTRLGHLSRADKCGRVYQYVLTDTRAKVELHGEQCQATTQAATGKRCGTRAFALLRVSFRGSTAELWLCETHQRRWRDRGARIELVRKWSADRREPT